LLELRLSCFGSDDLPRTPTHWCFGVSIIVLLICVVVLSSLDDKFIDKHIKEGYWPSRSRLVWCWRSTET
jgi:hypothetical protein